MIAPLHRCVYELTLEVVSPFLFPGISQAQLGIDASQLTDQDGHAIIPAEQIKGVLRQAFRDLEAYAPDSNVKKGLIDRLFGHEAASSAKDKPEDFDFAGGRDRPRGRLLFSDLRGPLIRDELGRPVQAPYKGSETSANDGLADDQHLTRIAIDDATSSVEYGSLQVVELNAAIGETVVFTGTLIVHGQDDGLLEKLKKAAKLIPALGAFKTAGFGRVQSFAVKAGQDARQAATVEGISKDKRVLVELQFDRPLMVDVQRISDNLFESGEVIPGGMLKGALAQSLRLSGQQPENDECLSRLIVGHAFPYRQGDSDQVTSYAAPLPASLAVFTRWDEQEGKTVNELRDCLSKDALPWDRNFGAGAFASDWKCDPDDVRKALGMPVPPEGDSHLLRVRTAIEPEIGTAATGQLFGYSQLCTTGRVWRTVIDSNGIPHADFRRLLNHLGQGLDDVGKSGARATVRFRTPANLPPLRSLNTQAHWAVMLHTPALLNNPDTLRDGTPLQEDYAAYWSSASGGSLEYVTHFGSQELVGGYQSLQFRRRAGEYEPWLLTQPGTVFLLKGDGAAWLAERLRKGLPPHDGLGLPDKSSTWKVCPYVPENGYGAFTLNAIDHDTLAEHPCRV